RSRDDRTRPPPLRGDERHGLDQGGPDRARQLIPKSASMRIVRKSKGSGNADVTQTVQQMTQKMLGKQLYVVHTTPVAPREQIMALLPANLEHQIKLEKAGIMFGAGPVVSEDGSAAGGLIVIRAASFEAAKKIADSDPLHKAG